MMRNRKAILLGTLLLLLGLTFAFTDKGSTFIAKHTEAASAPPAAEKIEQPAGRPSTPSDKNPFARIAKECSPAVVNVDTESTVTVKQPDFPFPDDPLFREFFGDAFGAPSRPQKRQVMGKGSGFIVSKEGYILTNNHVVEGADKIMVTLLDGRQFPAKLVGRDPTFDLAIIQIKASNLPVIPLGDSDKTQVGEWVTAIGNPLGFENTVTVGVVSGKNRTLQAQDINFQGFMQTDASINPGNSGGPLIDMDGRVVGINTAIVPYAQGIGFAVPINMAKQIMNDLIKHGEVKRGWLGIVVQTMTPSFAKAYKVPVSDGAIVADVTRNSPAEKAGLVRGDVITSVGGQKVKSSQDVVLFVRNHLAGDKVPFDVYRNGKKTTITVTLGNLPGSESVKPSKPTGDRGGKEQSKESTKVGATVVNVTSDLQKRFNLPSLEGVVVSRVTRGSKAEAIGLAPGDQVLEINRAKIRNVDDWNKALAKDPKDLVVLVFRSGQSIYLSSQDD